MLANAGSLEVVNFVLSGEKNPPLSEFEVILKDLKALLGTRNLVNLKEEENRREISLLAIRSGYPPEQVAALAPEIEAERADSVFKDATQGAVVRYQGANQLERSGIVDDPTSKALNVLLKELGAFPEVPAAETGSDELSLGKSGTRVGEVQEGLGQLGYSIPQQELAEAVFGRGRRAPSGAFKTRWTLPSRAGRMRGPWLSWERERAEQGGALWRVEGRLFHEHGGPAVGVKLRFQQSLFGGKSQRLAEQVTDVLGYYSATYSPQNEKVLLTMLALVR